MIQGLRRTLILVSTLLMMLQRNPATPQPPQQPLLFDNVRFFRHASRFTLVYSPSKLELLRTLIEGLSDMR